MYPVMSSESRCRTCHRAVEMFSGYSWGGWDYCTACYVTLIEDTNDVADALRIGRNDDWRSARMMRLLLRLVWGIVGAAGSAADKRHPVR